MTEDLIMGDLMNRIYESCLCVVSLSMPWLSLSIPHVVLTAAKDP
jgi:hypothetical protein